MSNPSPVGFRDAVDSGIAGRRASLIVEIVLVTLVVVSTCALIGVGLLLWNDRTSRATAHRQAARAEAQNKVYEKVIGDVYGALNANTASLARLEGRPVPAPIVPPTTPRPSTTTTTIRPASTAPRPAQPSSTSTTTTTAPKPSSTTTTTTAPPTTSTTCVTAIVALVCR